MPKTIKITFARSRSQAASPFWRPKLNRRDPSWFLISSPLLDSSPKTTPLSWGKLCSREPKLTPGSTLSIRVWCQVRGKFLIKPSGRLRRTSVNFRLRKMNSKTRWHPLRGIWPCEISSLDTRWRSLMLCLSPHSPYASNWSWTRKPEIAR